MATTNTRLGEYTIPAGAIIELPIYYLHNNPEWWPEPRTFDPDRCVASVSACVLDVLYVVMWWSSVCSQLFLVSRFLPEQKGKRPPCSFIPFSEGPRNCIGNRHALLLVKVALVEILLKFTVEQTVGMQVLRMYIQYLQPWTSHCRWLNAQTAISMFMRILHDALPSELVRFYVKLADDFFLLESCLEVYICFCLHKSKVTDS